jgi:cytochrome P450
VLVPITLKDGTHIPAGTRIACAKGDVLYNDTGVADFDFLRWYRKRHETGELEKHLVVLPEKEYMHFRYGRQACPGRQFAVASVKVLMVKLLSEYEFKYPEGKGRPKVFSADEYCFLNPMSKLVMRKRYKSGAAIN